MAVTYVGAGAGSETSCPHATGHQNNDFSLLFVECVSGTVTTPTDCSLVASVANAAGTVKLTVFSIPCVSGAMPNLALAGGSGDHLWGRVHTFRGVDLSDPFTGILIAYATAAATTGFTPGGRLDAGGMVAMALAWAIDDASDIASGWANASLTSVTERATDGTVTGNGGGVSVATGELAAAGVIGVGSLTVTSTTFASAAIGLRAAPATPFLAEHEVIIDGDPAPNGGLVEIWDDFLGVRETTGVIAGGFGEFSIPVQHNDADRYRAIYDDGTKYGASSLFTAT